MPSDKAMIGFLPTEGAVVAPLAAGFPVGDAIPFFGGEHFFCIIILLLAGYSSPWLQGHAPMADR